MAVDGTWNIRIKTLIGEREAAVILQMPLTLAFKGKVSGDTIGGSATTSFGIWPFNGMRR